MPGLADLRIHAPADAKARPSGEFVLYWMQTTMRAHDNFALNFAIEPDPGRDPRVGSEGAP